MSPRSSKSKAPHRKAKPDIYTLMLAISLVAIILGCLLLYLETKDYGSDPTRGAPSASLDRPARVLVVRATPFDRHDFLLIQKRPLAQEQGCSTCLSNYYDDNIFR